MNERLAQLAERIEEGDSLAELVEAMMLARQEYPADSPIGRFITAVFTSLCWERYGLDPLDRRRAVAAYRRAAEERPIDPRPSGKWTPDELAALGVLAGLRRQGEQSQEWPPRR